MGTDAGTSIDWDNRLWQQVWDVNLTQVERYNIVMAVLRRSPPGSAFEDLVARELAVRWRRRAVVMALVYGAWTVFWGLLAWMPLPPDQERSWLPAWCAWVGMLAIACCIVARHRFGLYVRLADTLSRSMPSFDDIDTV